MREQGGDATVVVEQGVLDAVVRVVGEVDIATSPALEETVTALAADGLRSLAIDLSAVTFMGSSGLAALLRAQRLAADAGGRLRLVAPSRSVRDVLQMTHLLERFEITD